MVEVQQADKEIAAELAHALGMTAEEFTSGACDVLVQIAARHRQAGVQQAFAERDGEIERLREALKPLVFFDMGKDEDEGAPFTTQDVWEMIFKDRVQDWFDFADIEAARQALAAKGDSRG